VTTRKISHDPGLLHPQHMKEKRREVTKGNQEERESFFFKRRKIT
jgi:hypothetical protein